MKDYAGGNYMEIFTKLSADWNGIEEIIPYGFGWEASRCIDKLMKDFKIPFIVDNSPSKKGMGYKGCLLYTSDAADD